MRNDTVIEIGKFILVGGSIAVLHLLFVYFLTSVIGWWYLTSTIVSYSIALVLNFVLQKFFVRKNNDTSVMGPQFIYFTLLSLTNLGLNVLAMYIFVSLFLWPYLLAQALIVGSLAAATFFINRTFIFR
jgi:putative flippase GtrA